MKNTVGLVLTKKDTGIQGRKIVKVISTKVRNVRIKEAC